MKLERKSEEAEIPTSSMADIAFLLIVFFMLTTVFSANKGMERHLPPNQKQHELIEPEEAIYVRVLSGDRFSVDQQEYPISEVSRLYHYVAAKIQVNPKKPVILHTDTQTPYGAMVKVLDQLVLLDEQTPNIPLGITIPSKAERARYTGQ